MTGVLVVAHGDASDTASSRAARAAVDAVRALGRFEQVEFAALKEGPAPHDVLSAMGARPLWVVPFFMADGWFVRTVIPQALQPASATYSILPAVGASSRAADAVIERAGLSGCTPSATALVVLGHGTPRAVDSRRSALRVADIIRRMDLWAEVLAAFTDDDPPLCSVADLTAATEIVAVPFFSGEGYHPSALAAQLTVPPGRKLTFTPSAGTSPIMAQIIVDLVTSAQETQQ